MVLITFRKIPTFIALSICGTILQGHSIDWLAGKDRWRKDLLTDEEKPRKEGMKEEGK